MARQSTLLADLGQPSIALGIIGPFLPFAIAAPWGMVLGGAALAVFAGWALASLLAALR